jgi:O-acetyl-ADP-ribose deacetylase (regulator of RNase III)
MPYAQNNQNTTYTTYNNHDILTNTLNIVKLDQVGYSIVIPHVCNNINVFGAGFAEAIASKYPEVKANYHLLGNSFLRNNLGYVQFIEVYNNQKYGHKLIVANMIAQNGIKRNNNPRPLNYIALAKAMLGVSLYIKGMQAKNRDYASKWTIHCPKFGSGLAGGNWNFISEMITDAWKDYSVFVYQPQHHDQQRI